ncbi:MAG TPA: hypothetical protein VGP62_09495 [Bryobacteraceae bacterium]|jgi:hypothetical protein|nr:hypothetical protein [Bryobacteraceae bacterium]
MNQPTLMTRFIGTPLVAVVAYVGVGLLLLGWWQGAVPWWLGLAALCFAGAVRTAARELRAYNRWLAAWQTMGMPRAAAHEPLAKPVSRSRKASSSWAGVVVAVLLLVVIPVLMASPGANEALRNGLGLFWLAMALYLVCKLAAKLYRAVARRSPSVSAGAKGGEASDVVQWALPCASSSPSRADAVRNLPEYSARLISGAPRG